LFKDPIQTDNKKSPQKNNISCLQKSLRIKRYDTQIYKKQKQQHQKIHHKNSIFKAAVKETKVVCKLVAQLQTITKYNVCNG
jgi:hypothetical protein